MMTMKRYGLFTALAAVCASLLITGCDKENTSEPIAEEVRLAMGITPTTEMTLSPSEAITETDGTAEKEKTAFDPGDVILLTASSETGDGVLSQTYQTGGPLKWENFSTLGETMRFAGCYPVPENKYAATFTFDMEHTEEADLLLAPAVEAQRGKNTEVALAFRHAMHRLNVSYKSSNGSYQTEELARAELGCTAKSTCTVDLKAGVLTGSPAGEMTYKTLQGQNVSLLLIPQKLDGLTLTVTIDGKSGVCTFPTNSDVLLEGGSHSNLIIDCSKKDSGEPEFTVTVSEIAGWDNQGDINGTVDI